MVAEGGQVRIRKMFVPKDMKDSVHSIDWK